MISLRHISLNNILTDINITIPEAGYIGIAGPNGSGKSSLARIIKGIRNPSEGDIYIDEALRPYGRVSHDIGIVLSSPENQLVSSSLEEDVAFGLENLNLPSPEIASKTEEALKWSGLWELRDVPAHHLSACQQQMLVLAGIMAMKPQCLILDEAVSVLESKGSALVLETVKRMNRETGLKIIHISHNLNELMEAETVFIMDKGRTVWEGSPKYLHRTRHLIKGLGMELPELIKLKLLLLEDGYDINEEATGVEEIAEEIIKHFGSPRTRNI